MNFRVGDAVFDQAGRPGVMTGRNEQNQLIVERQGEAYEKARRRGFINGLTQDQRTKFNEVMDKVFELKDPKARVSELTTKLDELKLDPRNHIVTRYLQGELTHIMNTEGIQPRTYKVDESNIRE